MVSQIREEQLLNAESTKTTRKEKCAVFLPPQSGGFCETCSLLRLSFSERTFGAQYGPRASAPECTEPIGDTDSSKRNVMQLAQHPALDALP